MLSAKRKETVARAIQNPIGLLLLRLGIHIGVSRNRIGVALACPDENGQVLLLRHVYHPRTPWGLPGGWMGRGEDPQSCALRELEEEIGLSAEIGPAIYISRELYPDHIGIAFLARLDPGNMKLNSEIIEAIFFPCNELPKPLTPFTLSVIDAAQDVYSMPSKVENLNHE
jgi:ADP-ribose pyrophosphatase YjhB (NUDIX family)